MRAVRYAEHRLAYCSFIVFVEVFAKEGNGSMEEKYTLKTLEERIGYHFEDEALLRQALTHSSFSNEQKINRAKNYERLEFLGDAVLELVTSEFLFKELPDVPEGELTKQRAALVCEPALAFCAKELELGRYLRLGKGEEHTGGRDRDSITADVMEAIIGAIFLDGGLENAKGFINRVILSDLENKKLFYDSKSSLQELVQGILKKEVNYTLLDESGPEHNKSFHVSVGIEGTTFGEGRGKTKKAAEQQAAYNALLALRDRGHHVFKEH